MSSDYFNQTELGQRIADARQQAQRSQADLAAAIGMDRTAVAKIEAGTRRVAAVELARISSALGRPIDWFVVASPEAVVSRRSAPEVTESPRLDRLLELVARDVAFLSDEGVLSPPEATSGLQLSAPRSLGEAEAAAGQVRSALDVPAGPLRELLAAVEQFGLLAFSLDLGAQGGDAGYVALDAWGVTVVNGAVDAGRRRFTLAHELGHHLFQDAYATDLRLADVGGVAEQRINTFAAHLLMPRGPLTAAWREDGEPARVRAIRLAADYRVSWSALCGHLEALGLVTPEEQALLLRELPTRADYLELGVTFESELQAPAVPPGYAQQVLRAYRQRRLGAGRVVELLHGVVSAGELSEPRLLPLDDLRPDFEPLP